MTITPRNHPLKLLLYFEWGMMAFVLLAELPPSFPREERHFLLNLFCLACFALLGLRLPKKSPDRQIHCALSALLWTVGTMVGRLRMFPLLCVIWVMRNCFMFPVRWRNTLTAGILLLAFGVQVDRLWLDRLPRLSQMRPLRAEIMMERSWIMIITSTLLLSLVLVFLQYLVDAVLSERQSREALKVANDRLRAYALKVEEVATVQERNRIAREIHDALGHSMTALNLHVDAALRLFQQDPAESQSLLQEAKLLGQQAFKDIRESIAALRADPLQGKTLAEAIVLLTEEFEKITAIQVKTTIALPHEVAPEFRTGLYRITQEALTNIAKYAQATEVAIALNAQGLSIQDNGQGFSPELTVSGFGLQGMRERTQALGGTFNLTAAPGQGCHIHIAIAL
jgi:signal transduction histidine kinase